MNKLYLTILLVIILFGTSLMPSIGSSEIETRDDIFLPPPLSVNMTYRDAIQSRCSVRTFTDEPVEDDILATVLWAAYGYRDDGS